MGCAGSKKAPQVETTCGVAWLCHVDRINCIQIVHTFRLCISKAWPESGSSNEWSCGWVAIDCCLSVLQPQSRANTGNSERHDLDSANETHVQDKQPGKQAADGRQAQSRVDASSASEHRAWPLPLCILSKHPQSPEFGNCCSHRHLSQCSSAFQHPLASHSRTGTQPWSWAEAVTAAIRTLRSVTACMAASLR